MLRRRHREHTHQSPSSLQERNHTGLHESNALKKALSKHFVVLQYMQTYTDTVRQADTGSVCLLLIPYLSCLLVVHRLPPLSPQLVGPLLQQTNTQPAPENRPLELFLQTLLYHNRSSELNWRSLLYTRVCCWLFLPAALNLVLLCNLPFTTKKGT